jgi:hypothetical protein
MIAFFNDNRDQMAFAKLFLMKTQLGILFNQSSMNPFLCSFAKTDEEVHSSCGCNLMIMGVSFRKEASFSKSYSGKQSIFWKRRN